MLLWIIGGAAGIAGLSFVRDLPALTLLFALVVTATLLLWLALSCLRPHKSLNNRRYKHLGKLALAISGVCAGIAWGGIHGWQLQHGLLPVALQQQALWVEGQVLGLPRQSRQRGQFVQKFVFSIHRIDAGQLAWQGRRVQLSWYDGPELMPGQRLRLRVKLKRPRGFANPVGLDYQLSLLQRRIDATGYVKEGDSRGTTTAHPLRLVERLRWMLHGRIVRLESNFPGARFLRALGLGDASALNRDDWDLLRATGTTHLFVVSGLHISLLSALAYGLCQLLGRQLLRLFPGHAQGLTIQRYAAIAALCLAAVYALLAGFGLPARRALIMLAVVWLALLGQRPVRPGWQFALALFLVLLYDPLAARSAGFWLSFTAVAVLLLGFSGRLGVASRRGAWLRAQLLMFAALTPLLLYWFQSASLLMPIANLLAVPLVSVLLVPLVLLAIAWLMIFATLPGIYLTLLDWLFGMLWGYLHALSDWQAHFSQQHSQQQDWTMDAVTLGFMLAVAIMLLLPRGLVPRSAMLLCCLPLFLPPATIHDYRDSAPVMTVLDVGQGLAVIVESQGKVLLYDAGPQYGVDFNAGAAIVVPFLRQRGYSSIDTLVLSHPDLDHAGGLASVLYALPVRQLFGSDVLSFHEESAPGHRASAVDGAANAPETFALCRAGDPWQWQGMRLQFLHPQASTFGKANNHSCVLRIESTSGHSVLLSGDIEKRIEDSLVTEKAEALRADVLLVPHHGSKTSSTADFIAAVNPDIAIHSAAYLSRFGHPHADVRERYAVAGVRQLNTARSGAIQVFWPGSKTVNRLSESSGIRVEEFRARARRYWLRW